MTDICLWCMANKGSTHTKMSDNTVEEGQCGVWSTPNKSKIPQVCAPITDSFPSETDKLREKAQKEHEHCA